ncbi:MAG: hypothetical protein GWN00_18120, partial [Aliifodinibius sp.]|nr:exodeoxyribonuclease V subunit gamma [candidate division Zixibacteria bacterium]NIT58068.1 exodeoxyribonuclease V subunit gamma [Fodinibius sp.]NIS47760.1 exodeoxyribonuclease V subunit gamma [candidate division Zixibacteria bacterium]NIU15866.1 exodeoxyribonuclease V subunit gamma [candidate division Zixibacteria bacterium]NIV08012.1 hypothetical protein [candidate division Zixibacteria bacterium]
NLWNELVGHWGNRHDENKLHRAQLLKELWDAIEHGDINREDIPDRISVFGVSSVSPAFIRTMVKLSKLTDVHFYHLSVDPVIHESEQFKNPLLQSLGQEGANFMSLFSEHANVD